MAKRVTSIDFLRGIASLGVVLYHFSNSGLPSIEQNYLSSVFFYGQYGVQVFFVISGFIIPYSMYKSGYSRADYFKNLYKRFLRVCPPSYIAVLLSFILYYSCIVILNRPIKGAEWPGINFTALVANLTYIVPYLDTCWYNQVYWTLGIEFQFYFIIGVLFPMLTKNKLFLNIFVLSSILLLDFTNVYSIFTYGAYFVLGILLFMQKEKLIEIKEFIFLLFFSFIIMFYRNEFSAVVFGIVAFLFLFLVKKMDFKFTNYLGKISYSLYITHMPAGAMSEALMKRILPIHDNDLGKIVLLIIYVIISLVCSDLFYRYVEEPFVKKSKKIKYSN